MYYQIVDDTMYIGSTKWSDDCDSGTSISNDTIKHLRMKNPIQDSLYTSNYIYITVNNCVDAEFDMAVMSPLYLSSSSLLLLNISSTFSMLDLTCPLITSLNVPTLLPTSYIHRDRRGGLGLHLNECISLKELTIEDQSMPISLYCRNCTSLESVDLSNVLIQNFVSGSYSYGMFYGCTSLTDVKLNLLGSSYLSGGMFENCTSLKSAEIFQLIQDTTLNNSRMFYGCTSLESVKGNFIIGTCDSMFYKCSKLKTINCSGDWYGSATGNNMFYDCTSLVGGNGTKYDSSKTGISMAVIDQDGQEGYLTYTKNRDLYNVNIYNSGTNMYVDSHLWRSSFDNIVYSVTDSQHMVAAGTTYNIKQTNTSGIAMVGAVVVDANGVANVYQGNDITFPVESELNVYIIRDLPNITLNAVIKAIANPQ